MPARIRAIEKAYLDRDAKKTFKVWHPQVKVEGKWCFLPDDSSRTKLQEAADEVAAFEMAIKAIKEIDVSMNPG
ncbi:hypothetical protein [Paenibacillus sp. FJAT-26967]|uniref:hypothetical protein n=1 Tax=Paenibacillus sp. FJAT-26967 TaxID=1729690 RepID=UPI0008389C71|nr:hypothetical protein [Paenibacillus sp. FJAT-26967]